MASAPVLTITPEEYLRRERASEERHEYFAGRIYAMAGGSPEHATISGNIFALLWHQLRGMRCQAQGSDFRIRVRDTGLYTYPDVSVVCGEPQFDDAERDTVLNPKAIFEVLSPSPEAYDRGDKFAHYRTIVSLTDYLLVAQDKPRIEHYRRSGEEWILTTASGLEATLRIESIGCELKLSEVYERIEFPPIPAPGHP